MKRIFLLVAFGAVGLINAKSKETKEVKSVSNAEINVDSKTESKYHPITLTSSCGYTQTIEVGPNDQPDCWLTDAQQMEDDCTTPFSNPQLAGFWP